MQKFPACFPQALPRGLYVVPLCRPVGCLFYLRVKPLQLIFRPTVPLKSKLLIASRFPCYVNRVARESSNGNFLGQIKVD